MSINLGAFSLTKFRSHLIRVVELNAMICHFMAQFRREGKLKLSSETGRCALKFCWWSRKRAVTENYGDFFLSCVVKSVDWFFSTVTLWRDCNGGKNSLKTSSESRREFRENLHTFREFFVNNRKRYRWVIRDFIYWFVYFERLRRS
jgi:hypothetical protein